MKTINEQKYESVQKIKVMFRKEANDYGLSVAHISDNYETLINFIFVVNGKDVGVQIGYNELFSIDHDNYRMLVESKLFQVLKFINKGT